MGKRNYLAVLFLGFVVLGLISPVVSAGIPGSVTLKIQQKTWFAEAYVYATINYYVQINQYGVAKFDPLGSPYNYIHLGSHSGTGSNAYWKSVDTSTSNYALEVSGWWHVDALWNSRDGTMKLSVGIAYEGPSPLINKEIGVQSIGRPYLLVRYAVDDSGGNQLANELKNIAIGAIESYLVSA
ncbi:hypothetical protein [Thermococcus waiotapuensis]|uniref:Uncharacterized protein n=1 Tax=Thermococcus waiotapuensis TaxID=90909 RepID=A0AAE4T0M8_9EURY|nr:hypothetical protein [Thermococcus waiotapuensis]MDV3103325.1 hypothetical protein [Thermococcus waiotapuensis]